MTFDWALAPPIERPKPRLTGWREPSILPGFPLALGVTLTYLGAIVVIPLAALALRPCELGIAGVWRSLTEPRVLHALELSFGISAVAALANAPLGLLIAWVLTRYEFPGRRLLDALVDLPFALPTAVAGIALTALYAPTGPFGAFAARFGVKTAYTPLGIFIALLFIGLPFVVRQVQPLLIDFDPEVEEAAKTLGATPLQRFAQVMLPALAPALASGVGLAFARGVGEYGSVIFIAGNMPYRSEIAPLIVVIRLEEFDYAGAAAVGLAMVVISFASLLLINAVQVALSARGAADVMRPRVHLPGLAPLMLGAAVLAMTLLVAAPLAVVFTEALAKGLPRYAAAFGDPDLQAAIRLTLLVAAIAVPLNAAFGLAAAWSIARFEFRGKAVLLALIDLPFSMSPVVSGLVWVLLFGAGGWLGPFLDAHGIRIIFDVTGIVLATITVTLPFVARELIPLMQDQGSDEEAAAVTLGAGGLTVFRRITLPNVRWALFYGVLLCNARAMGEFGAVSVVSGKIRGVTNTLPLHIEALYNDYDFVGAFAAASLLASLGLVTLGLKTWLEWRYADDLARGAR